MLRAHGMLREFAACRGKRPCVRARSQKHMHRGINDCRGLPTHATRAAKTTVAELQALSHAAHRLGCLHQSRPSKLTRSSPQARALPREVSMHCDDGRMHPSSSPAATPADEGKMLSLGAAKEHGRCTRDAREGPLSVGGVRMSSWRGDGACASRRG